MRNLCLIFVAVLDVVSFSQAAALLPSAAAVDEAVPSKRTPASPIVTALQGVSLNLLADALDGVAGGIASDAAELSMAASAYASLIQAASPSSTPTDIPDAQRRLSSIFSANAAKPTSLSSNVVQLVGNGFRPDDFSQHVIQGSNPLSPLNSVSNVNKKEPKQPVFPSAGKKDAPYSISEAGLRGAIHIPSTFTFGAGKGVPLIFVPGTGAFGGSTFESNMIKLLQGSDIADVCWLNIPGALLGDIQDNAEYVAYAVNYIYGVTGKKVALASWSQGSLDIAWAFTYWPSIRDKVQDVINYSGDLHGTVNAYALCPGFPKLPCDPSIVQQTFNSSLVSQLRKAGGASAYVPTTTIYSSFFDEIVQPQTLDTASAFVQDARGVGVSNNEIQSVCAGRPGGGFYTHEGVMLAPLAYHLTVDALTHDGPGLVSRVGLDKACGAIVTPGLSLADVLATESLIPVALLNVIFFTPKTFTEPPLRSYAQ